MRMVCLQLRIRANQTPRNTIPSFVPYGWAERKSSHSGWKGRSLCGAGWEAGGWRVFYSTCLPVVLDHCNGWSEYNIRESGVKMEEGSASA